MAIRVRKLAKEVRLSAGEVLGLLHHLGYVNYKRPDDMVSDPPADKLRRAVKRGVVAPSVDVAEQQRRPTPREGGRPAGNDLMAQLVPGVVKQGGATPAPRPAPAPAPVPAGPAAPPPVAVPEPAVHERALADAEAARRDLAAQVAGLQAELAEAKAAQEAAEAELLTAQAVPAEGASLVSLVEARGLRGRDEVLRALEALLVARGGQVILDARLQGTGAAALERELAGLLLLDGPPPEELTVPAVAVSEDRAEAPGAPTLDRQLHDLSEHMLLSGWRRLALVGVPPRWHGAIGNRLDRRVEVSFRPAGPWTAEQVQGLHADLVGAVGLAAPAQALEASAATWVLEDGLGPLLRRLVAAARGDDSGG